MMLIATYNFILEVLLCKLPSQFTYAGYIDYLFISFFIFLFLKLSSE